MHEISCMRQVVVWLWPEAGHRPWAGHVLSKHKLRQAIEYGKLAYLLVDSLLDKFASWQASWVGRLSGRPASWLT